MNVEGEYSLTCYPTVVKYSALTDKLERNCNFPAPGSSCYNIGNLILFVYEVILDS
jgi:hypothetical protein